MQRPMAGEGSVQKISAVSVSRNIEVRLRDGPEPPPRETKTPKFYPGDPERPAKA